MKQHKIFKVMATAFILCVCMFIQMASAFDSGSTGADGAFAPTSSTVLQIPEGGVLNYTTVNIPTGVTITFLKNSQNTPVTMLATGEVTIAGTINLNAENGNYIIAGAGGPGGFDGGVGGVLNQIGKRGEGPGGGTGGSPRTDASSAGGCGGGGGFKDIGGTGGSPSAAGGAGGTAYGNERILPLIGGSGGGAGGGTNTSVGGAGGGGGGSIAIASSGAINITGTITANGGTGANGETDQGGCANTYKGGAGGGGSGGSIRLIANTIAGNGLLNAVGGAGGLGSFISACTNVFSGGAGSLGRIRFEYSTTTRTAATNPPMSVGAPYAVIPENMPTLVIASAGGVNAPSVPKGSFGSPDVILPFNAQNPVTVVVTGVNIPANTTVTVKSSPSVGTATSATGILSGNDTSSSASILVTISKAYPSVLSASVTFQLASLGMGPIYAQGELVDRVRVEAAMGGGSTMTYITASGKEIPAKQLKS